MTRRPDFSKLRSSCRWTFKCYYASGHLHTGEEAPFRMRGAGGRFPFLGHSSSLMGLVCCEYHINPVSFFTLKGIEEK